MGKQYYVGSSGDSPERIYFSREDAFKSGYTYLDLFNADGEWAEGYKLIDGKYTSDF